jgi:hypothetical protein
MNLIIQLPRIGGIRSIVSNFEDVMNSPLAEFPLSFRGFCMGLPVFELWPKLVGGKGGFGKLLKSQKNIGKKTDNFDSCRDLEEKIRKLKEEKQKESAAARQVSESSVVVQVALDRRYIDQLAQVEESRAHAVMDGFKAIAPVDVSAKSAALSISKGPKKLALFDDSD